MTENITIFMRLLFNALNRLSRTIYSISKLKDKVTIHTYIFPLRAVGHHSFVMDTVASLSSFISEGFS